MTTWSTLIYAVSNITREITCYAGQNIEAPTRKLAEAWCKKYVGYLHVSDELIAEIPADPNTLKPDFKNMIDYDTQNN